MNEEKNLDALLQLFPFENTVYEVILTLFQREKGEYVPNASALGVRRVGRNLISTLFQGSNSFQALEMGAAVGICIPPPPECPEMFIRAALSGYGNNEREFSDGDYDIVSTDDRKVLVLKACQTRIILRAKEITERTHRDGLGECRVKDVVWEVVDIRASESIQSAYSRFTGLLFEALIEGSRYISTGNNECLKRAETYLRRAKRLASKEEMHWLGQVRRYLYSSSSSRLE